MEDPIFYLALEPGQPHREELEKNLAQLVRLARQVQRLEAAILRFNNSRPLLQVSTEGVEKQRYWVGLVQQTLEDALAREP